MIQQIAISFSHRYHQKHNLRYLETNYLVGSIHGLALSVLKTAIRAPLAAIFYRLVFDQLFQLPCDGSVLCLHFEA